MKLAYAGQATQRDATTESVSTKGVPPEITISTNFPSPPSPSPALGRGEPRFTLADASDSS